MTTTPFTAVRTECTPINFNYTVKFDRTISSPEEWQEEIETIRLAKAGDSVTIYVNTCGGSMATLTEVLHTISKSEAHFHCVLAGNAYSAGGPIMLACDSVEVGEFADMMVHTAQTGYGGSSDAMKSYSDHTAKVADKLLRKCYEGFCTEEEISLALVGKDFWFDSDEIVRRLELRNTWREEQEKSLITEDVLETNLESMTNDVIFSADQLNLDPLDLLKLLESRVGELAGEIEDNSTKESDFIFFKSDFCGNSLAIYKEGYISFGEGNYLNFARVHNLETYRVDWYKYYADILGIKYAHNISLDKLVKRMDDKVKELVASLKD